MGAFTSVVKCKEVRGYFLVTLGIRYLERQNFVVKKLAEECNRNIA